MNFRMLSISLFTVALVISGASYASGDAIVKTYGIHDKENIVYHFQITNNSSRPMSSFAIGFHSYPNHTTDTYDNYSVELTEMLVGYDRYNDLLSEEKTGLRSSQGENTSPSEWIGSHVFMEESNHHMFEWRRQQTASAPILLPKQTFNFTATVRKEDRAYLNGHFVAYFGDGKSPWSFTDVMQIIDTQAPALSLSVDPSTIWPPNNKLVPVNVKVTVRDDYDPAPEIQLVSIVANETLASGDIANAEISKDDRSFDLMAARAGGNKDGRIYTITYAAIDGSGNKSTASVNVVVPHDQRK